MNEFEAITDLDKGFAITKLDDKYGFVNENFEVVVEFKYDKVNSFHENFAIVSLVNKSKYVNSQNEEIIYLTDKYSFINTQGEEVISFKYDHMFDFQDGVSIVTLNNKCSLINTLGEELIPFKYDYIDDFIEGQAVVSLNKKYGIINQKGEEIIPCKYNQMWTCYTEKKIFRVFRLEDKYGFITEEGNEILLNEYKDIILGNRTLYYSKYKGNIIYVMMDKYEYERYIVFFGEKEEFKEWLYKNEVINYDEYINHINKIEQQLLEN